MAILFDTGPLVAFADIGDSWHQSCVSLIASSDERLLVPVTVVPEACYLLWRRLGSSAELALLSDIARGSFELVDFLPGDLGRTIELARKYEDFPLGFVDASVVALAERLGIKEVATIDRKHFSAVRPCHLVAFELLP